MTATDKPKAPGLLDGKYSPTRPLAASGNLFAFALDTMRALPKRPFQLREFIQQTWFVASVTILPTALVAIPFGAVIALQLGSLTRQLGAQSFTGSASVLAVLREASPIVTALLIAGAGGSAICADLGARKIRDEIDAMEVLGISPIQRLVVPRFVAAILISIALTGLVCFTGFLASYLFNVYFQHGAPGSFVGTFASFTTTADMKLAMVKAVVYGAIVGVVACEKGLSTRGGSIGVANSVNSSVVESILLLMIVNVAISQLYLILFPKTGL